MIEPTNPLEQTPPEITPEPQEAISVEGFEQKDPLAEAPLPEPSEEIAGINVYKAAKTLLSKKAKPKGDEASALLEKYGIYEDKGSKELKQKIIELESNQKTDEIVGPLVDDKVPQSKPTMSEQKEEFDLQHKDLEDYDEGDSWQMNFDTIEGPDDIKAIIAETAERNKEQITEARRGVVGDEQLRGLAEDIGGNYDEIKKVLTRENGELMGAEYILATRQIIEKSAIKLKEYALAKKSGQMTEAKMLEASKQLYFHQQIQQQFMGMRAEYGRGMRAMGVPTGIGADMEQRMIQEKLASVDMRMGVGEMLDDINMMDTTTGINTLVNSKTNWKKGFDSVYEMWVNSILSGAKTFNVNTVGSALRLGVDSIDHGIATMMGKGKADLDNQINVDTFLFHEFGKWSSLMDALKVGWQASKTGEQYKGLSRLDGGETRAISSTNYGMADGSIGATAVDIVGNIIRFPTERLMGGTDAFFRRIGEGAKTASVAYREASMIAKREGLNQEESLNVLRELMDNPSPNMIKEAQELADDLVFQRPLGELGSAFVKTISKTPGVRYVVPFVKTPVNLLKQGFLERTPFGVLSKRTRDDIMAGGARGQMARSKMLTGTTLGSAIWAMSSKGMVTGSEPSDPALRKAWRDAKIQPRSFVFKNDDGTTDYVPYDRLEPFSYIMGAVADINSYMYGKHFEELTDDEDAVFEKSMGALTVAIAENTLNKTFMTGIRDIMNVWQDPKRYGKRYLQNQFNSFIPYSALRRDLARVQDPYMKVANDLGDFIENKTPFVNNNNPETINAWGEKVKYHHILNPYETMTKTDDFAKIEMVRIANETNEYPIKTPSKMLEGVKLTPHQHNRLIEISRTEVESDGKYFKDTIEEIMVSEEYMEADDFQKSMILREIANVYDTIARQLIKNENDEILRKVLAKKQAPLIRNILKDEPIETQKAALEDEVDVIFDEIRGE